MSQKFCSAAPTRVRPEHYCNTCWSTKAPTGNGQTTKAGLVWTCHQAGLSVHDCYPGTLEGVDVEAVRKKLDEQ
ncbi:hypothetical protein DPMN_011747 [Dreissena polymorpha]|uniref:Uncharacterized protein n=1 Tax=Dreissena polymorpha TaxID=45954 RepID=A0A9D4S274_DREPO|nr:hypothetical protein DPMN_011747 [Dreissena polymorpha]